MVDYMHVPSNATSAQALWEGAAKIEEVLK